MSKRTAGERLASSWAASLVVESDWPTLASEIDRAIRRAQAKAWDECYVRICESDLVMCADLKVPRDDNPYRGRKK